MEHIKAEIVKYVVQHEGEKIVGEDKGIGRGEGGTDKDGLGGDKDSEAEAKVHVEQIMAFLKGDLSAKKQPQQTGHSPSKNGECPSIWPLTPSGKGRKLWTLQLVSE